MPDPISQAALRQNFLDHIQQLVQYQQRKYQASTNSGTFNSYTPPPTENWDGDLFDLINMAAAFLRDNQNEDFQNVASNSGVQADYILMTLQGDFIATIERAYRARHQTSVRTRMHAAARYRGHSFPTGVLQLGLQGYLEWLEKQAKEQRGSG